MAHGRCCMAWLMGLSQVEGRWAPEILGVFLPSAEAAARGTLTRLGHLELMSIS